MSYLKSCQAAYIAETRDGVLGEVEMVKARVRVETFNNLQHMHSNILFTLRNAIQQQWLVAPTPSSAARFLNDNGWM